ncbi:MAG: DUF1559 domain-containing protein [Planctomycetaceae bacterium]|nr:DUF1559 domain-containing protein [Planctomycetaceae bacterium]
MPRSWLRASGFTASLTVITSGTSNTVAFSEGIIGSNGPAGGDNRGGRFKELMTWGIHAHYNQIPQDCLNTRGPNGMFRDPNQETHSDTNHWLGKRAWDNFPGATQFYTLMPPNSPNCSSGYIYAWMSAASNHPGGVGVSFHDGSVNLRAHNESVLRASAAF